MLFSSSLIHLEILLLLFCSYTDNSFVVLN
jgi:hypothetical protein